MVPLLFWICTGILKATPLLLVIWKKKIKQEVLTAPLRVGIIFIAGSFYISTVYSDKQNYNGHLKKLIYKYPKE